jgi:hypothetical protein
MKQVQNKFLGGFTVSIARDALHNYLVISLDSTQKVIPYQVGIINNNSSPGIMFMEERVINNQSELYYRLKNGSISLSRYLDKDDVDIEELIEILDNIVGILLGSKNFLLYGASFLLHEDYIYLNPALREVYLIYIPVNLAGDVNENFRDLLKRISLCKEEFYQNINVYYLDSDFSIGGFREKIKEMKFSVLKKERQSKEKGKPFQLEVCTEQHSPEEIIPAEDENTGGLQEIQFELMSRLKEKEISPSRKKAIYIFSLVQLAIVIILVLSSSYLSSVKATTATYGGIALIVIAVNLLLLKKLFKEEENSLNEIRQINSHEKPAVTLKKEKL